MVAFPNIGIFLFLNQLTWKHHQHHVDCTHPRSLGCPISRVHRLAATKETSSATPIPPPPPLSMPVWSLAAPRTPLRRGDSSTKESSSDTCATSMNIVTFASAVSVATPKYWMISLYYDTLTKDSFCEAGEGVLQLLTPSHKHLVPVLGKRSGYEQGYSKSKACQSAGVPWVKCEDFVTGKMLKDEDQDHDDKECKAIWLLPRCATYLHVRLESTVDAGDHLVTICKLVSTGEWDEEHQAVRERSIDAVNPPIDHVTVLYTGLLREEGII